MDGRACADPCEPLAAQWERLRYRCHRASLRTNDVDLLERFLGGTTSGKAMAMMATIDLCIADTGFILVTIDDGKCPGLAPSFLETVEIMFDRKLVARSSPRLGWRVRLRRPTPLRLERFLDRDLVAATLDTGQSAIEAWLAWRARESLDETLDFGEIAPMLSENLARLGVSDVDAGRINGIRRRAWYQNQLLTRLAATAVEGLQREGIDPILLGDLPAAVHAAETRSVRPVRALELCVQPDEAARAADVVTRIGWTPVGEGSITERRVQEHTWQRFRIDPGHVLFLHWRPLPQACSQLVMLHADRARGQITLHGTSVATLSPTSQLLRLWARTGDPDPGHQLRTVCDTADLLERHPREIDWTQLWSDCERLGLVEYGEAYLRVIPAGLGDPGRRELRRWSPE